MNEASHPAHGREPEFGARAGHDWNPRSPAVLDNQIAAYDGMRRQCPVAHSEYLHWSLFRHADVSRVLQDHSTFSNAVSSHLSVPNGMDPPLHTGYRKLIEPYFDAQRVAAFEPACRAIANSLVAALPNDGNVDLAGGFTQDYALQIQCAYLGWPATLHEPLRAWIRKNHSATLAGDRPAMALIALEFDHVIRQLLAVRRDAGDRAPDDLTTQLLQERIDGSALSDEVIVSILRNWTVGELGTIAASVGILVHYLAEKQVLQRQLREQPSLLPPAIDEILRIHAPLISARRITTQPVELGGRQLDAGTRISLMWASANRDETVFGDPDHFRLDRDPALNLLYGAGIHLCPGAALARLELQILLEALLRHRRFALQPGTQPHNAVYPASGFSSLLLRVDKITC
ncbi:MAG: cytochrome P450 [Lysobacter sp.]